MNSASINLKIPMQLYDAEGQENFMYMWKAFPKKPVLDAIALSVTKTTLNVKDHDGPDGCEEHEEIENVEEKDKSDNHSGGVSGPPFKKVKIEQGLQPCLDDVFALARGEEGRPWHKAIDILNVCKAHRTMEFIEWMCQTNPKIGRTQMEEVWKRPESDSPEKDIELFLSFLKATDPGLGTIKMELGQSRDEVKDSDKNNIPVPPPPHSAADILVGHQQDKKEDEPEEPTTVVGQDKKDKDKENEGMAPEALAPTILADAGGDVEKEEKTPEGQLQEKDEKIMAPTPTPPTTTTLATAEALVAAVVGQDKPEGPLQEQDAKMMATPAEADGVVGDDKTAEGQEEKAPEGMLEKKHEKIMAPTPTPTTLANPPTTAEALVAAVVGQDKPEGPLQEQDAKMMATPEAAAEADGVVGDRKTEEGKEEKMPEGPLQEKDGKIMAPTPTPTTPPQAAADAAAARDKTDEEKEKIPEGPSEKENKMMAPPAEAGGVGAAAPKDPVPQVLLEQEKAELNKMVLKGDNGLWLG